jgi:hypothetical protein
MRVEPSHELTENTSKRAASNLSLGSIGTSARRLMASSNCVPSSLAHRSAARPTARVVPTFARRHNPQIFNRPNTENRTPSGIRLQVPLRISWTFSPRVPRVRMGDSNGVAESPHKNKHADSVHCRRYLAEREGWTGRLRRLPLAIARVTVVLAKKLHCVDLFTSGRTSGPSGSNG